MEEFKKISHKRLRLSMFASSPPYPGTDKDDPYAFGVPEGYEAEYRRYLALVYSYDGYRKFPGQSAMALYGYFRHQFEEGRPPGELPEDFDVLRMLLFVCERNARHQGWYDSSHKRFAEALINKLQRKVADKDFD